MKLLSILFFLLSLPFFDLAQSYIGLNKIFYGLPINDSRLKIKTKLTSDGRFLEKAKSDSSFFDSYKNTYFGNIGRHSLPTQFSIDSATIELTWGYGMFTKGKGKGKGHELTLIKLQYYVPNMAASNILTHEFWDSVKDMSSDTTVVTVGRKEDNNFSYGRQIKIDQKKYFPQLRILQQEYNNSLFIVRVEYERLGD